MTPRRVLALLAVPALALAACSPEVPDEESSPAEATSQEQEPTETETEEDEESTTEAESPESPSTTIASLWIDDTWTIEQVDEDL